MGLHCKEGCWHRQPKLLWRRRENFYSPLGEKTGGIHRGSDHLAERSEKAPRGRDTQWTHQHHGSDQSSLCMWLVTIWCVLRGLSNYTSAIDPFPCMISLPQLWSWEYSDINVNGSILQIPASYFPYCVRKWHYTICESHILYVKTCQMQEAMLQCQ